MSRLRVQQVLARFLPALQQQQTLSHQQLTVCRHLQQCRTEALGGFKLHCGHCGHETMLYHACR
ncbi:MAG: transposase zinc-binding domain-containing protein, partial [Methylococcales bacterium]|nr:transposase zinc-binding domain-containing protein [Methylococcales bacterium]